ncbi:arsenite methyltransferase [Thermincola potens]|uniref:Arsenite methyltransferase n=1 Tax=Thermincola potens (strain JR) TaxID=635013 RepID=D5XB11_THEPJ|nr:arsenite methyltransferase [Thermincola potens]ADG81331.1 Methyltransferase type 11 [Thermincola potens JR]
MDKIKIIKTVRETYGAIARQQNGSGCGCGCYCSGDDINTYVQSLGYSPEELNKIPTEANLALSCGNPTALAGLKEGEVVLDLGSGAGFDCFLAASKVGPAGRVIGVDMTPEMIERARTIAARENFSNVEFRLGEIENLPVADNSVDVVISNCVINLSADKKRVFREIYRVLKPGGRVAISDVALLKELPEAVRMSMEAYSGCIAGAVPLEHYKLLVEEAGLTDIVITDQGFSFSITPDTKDPLARAVLESLEEGQTIEQFVTSIYVQAKKSQVNNGA